MYSAPVGIVPTLLTKYLIKYLSTYPKTYKISTYYFHSYQSTLEYYTLSIFNCRISMRIVVVYLVVAITLLRSVLDTYCSTRTTLMRAQRARYSRNVIKSHIFVIVQI
jgi:excinuclease UvrABC helicase subunit UvrB